MSWFDTFQLGWYYKDPVENPLTNPKEPIILETTPQECGLTKVELPAKLGQEENKMDKKRINAFDAVTKAYAAVSRLVSSGQATSADFAVIAALETYIRSATEAASNG